ncbi:membrane-bound O-acyltransferase family MBOAT [Leptospira noguchii str. 1993005606]|uniref:Membrane-bound O-acyltransferase family MBOAT n=2 Tax=Leptospira noguchii TaxID=28182 RepID=M6YIQ0_9LEPT|nr:MBOAT family O-acyltransferase [Leptospira noguchii]EMM98741.1 membrane-bound O-acyltransferase family MBOAT [Leptospira noguchii str. 2007001578]EMO89479.1 membrane-bound O-acyltransferase family MBOAT [Leptospira noguchii str. 2001034031]EPE86089.1 membrane-bound O-acyltransferase family MBOAT [Leptospira noguchii str. 1993005606]
MLFNSLNFLFFFIGFCLIYFRLGLKGQNRLLFFGGLFFYGYWKPEMVLLLLFCISFNFAGGIWLGKTSAEIRGKRIFVFLIVLNLGILIFFKYILFFLSIWNDFLGVLFPSSILPIPEILLPIGISFYTLHNISYLFDIRSRKITPCSNFIRFGVYDLFFPLLLAGPIERPDSLLPQIEKERVVDQNGFVSGAILFFWGMFKKVFIGDHLLFFTNKVMEPGMSLPSGMIFWIAFSFAFQVYADFSGYTDGARGLAKMLGFKLSLNFNFPFISSNPSEFWKRWHISLSTWLRDYLYIPLGGNRVSLFRQNVNLMIVWILGGLWHGATYGYLVWGFYCGLQVVFYNLIQKYFLNLINKNIKVLKYSIKIIGLFLTFWMFALGLLLFQVNSPAELWSLIENTFGGFYWNSVFAAKLFFLLFPLFCVEFWMIVSGGTDLFFDKIVEKQSNLILFSFGIGILFCLFGVFEKKEFFYFQF